jgi:hypothetical protein
VKKNYEIFSLTSNLNQIQLRDFRIRSQESGVRSQESGVRSQEEEERRKKKEERRIFSLTTDN